MQLSSDRIAIKANIIRQNVVRMLQCAGSGHYRQHQILHSRAFLNN
jgi:transketolase N-terminal domain/subunit